ncbi:rod shape-determining protein RodA [Paenibacillus tritici]|uniref:Rod shape-determining protein RodA n=1 Tax=Paenibacillus tritici TaxID=1873425 RepID=A0ABX2DR41_9BACL|nr:FtsW/RodA/SpoVE family cell cycle protein [Paenibacillus tritici]NQX47139.1 rod shape-determining protein RodA [Paenibacillus tritici]QUL54607.1 rod shape-determining protein RodA [Paenibacillus tritici]
MLQKIKKIDGVILVILVLLMVVSIFSIYSVTHGRDRVDGSHIKMMKFYIVGFIAFIGLTFVDYRLLVKYALYVYVTGIGILVLVSFIGTEQNGAQGWIKFGSFGLQPAELFKLILILFLAAVLVRKNKNKLLFWRDVVPLGLLSLLPFIIVISQNDLGNALSYIVILVGLLWIGNIKFTHALIGLLIIGGTAAAGIMSYIHYHDEIKDFLTDIKRSHWIERFDPWLVPDKATAKAIYHTKNAKMAIASGGMSGEGYMAGTSVQTDRVPYTYSDSIFVQIAEEYGFVGSALVLLLYFILIHRMILIALECKDRGGPFLIVGVVAMLLYQIFENIGAFLGLMPLTGITLPFISFGGTSLLINMASIGLVMSVRLHGQEVEEDLPSPALYSPSAKKV